MLDAYQFLQPRMATASQVMQHTWGQLVGNDLQLVVYGAYPPFDAFPKFLPRDLVATTVIPTAGSDWTCDPAAEAPSGAHRYVMDHSWTGVNGARGGDVAACANTESEVRDHVEACSRVDRIHEVRVDGLEQGPGAFILVNELNGVDHLAVPFAEQCGQTFTLCTDDAECPSVCGTEGFCAECNGHDDCDASEFCDCLLYTSPSPRD